MPMTDKIKLTIDGKNTVVEKGATVLQAAQAAGIYIPTLCYHPNLQPYGGCRLCIVEIENMRGLPTACTTPAADGMKVTTNTTAAAGAKAGFPGAYPDGAPQRLPYLRPPRALRPQRYLPPQCQRHRAVRHLPQQQALRAAGRGGLHRHQGADPAL